MCASRIVPDWPKIRIRRMSAGEVHRLRSRADSFGLPFLVRQAAMAGTRPRSCQADGQESAGPATVGGADGERHSCPEVQSSVAGGNPGVRRGLFDLAGGCGPSFPQWS